MTVYNNQPKPRALLEELNGEVVAQVRKLFPSVREVRGYDELYEDEADVLVTGRDMLSRSPHLHVVAFGSEYLGVLERRDGKGSGAMRYGADTTLAEELYVADHITGELGQLVRTYLVPYFSSLAVKPALSIDQGHTFTRITGHEVIPWCTPFLVAGDGSVLAAAFRRRNGGRCWVLPADCADPAAWVSAALSEFREIDPDRVPELPAWWETSDWATREQQQARAAVAVLDAEREQVMADFDRKVIAAKEQVRSADEAAAHGPLRLLTADSDQLAGAVRSALKTLGFHVEDMDAVYPEGARREDLRVQDSDFQGWTAIVEIKGYTRGASVNDLARLNRWSARYAVDEGELPDAMWHVVNAFRNSDPDGRPEPIPNDADLADFQSDGGLLIDTRQLFRALKCVQDGTVSAELVRESLRNSRGRWRAPTSATAEEHA